jgi:hypothetical protein
MDHFHSSSAWLANFTPYAAHSNAKVSFHNYYFRGSIKLQPFALFIVSFLVFFPLTFLRHPATLQHVTHGPVVVLSGSYFCFFVFLLFFLFSAQKSKNKGTSKHYNIHPFDAFHRSSASKVQPVPSQRSNLKPQEKPNQPPTSKRAVPRSHHMRRQGPKEF